MWFSFINTYDSVYLCIEDNIHFYYDRNGKYLTQSYLLPSPNNQTQVTWYNKPSIILEETPTFTIGENYTCMVEFTSEGIVYGFGTYTWHEPKDTGQRRLSGAKYDYIFVPYDDE